ncbi:MAG TPA: sigma-70 family RNA polymerase sigma factor [Chloroflexi bacterium]|nr:sigma-70 family RNA polymerase sigma factor [Chloroflexota bacterium]
MYSYIYRRVGDAATAEDLTGELFLRVVRSLRNDRAWRESFSAWLYRIAHNLVVDHYRSLPEHPEQPVEAWMEGDGGDLAAALEARAGRERLRAATRRLTPEQQEVLALRYGEGLTSAETGRILKKSTGAVEALQHRALASLRRILAGEEL